MSKLSRRKTKSNFEPLSKAKIQAIRKECDELLTENSGDFFGVGILVGRLNLSERETLLAVFHKDLPPPCIEPWTGALGWYIDDLKAVDQ